MATDLALKALTLLGLAAAQVLILNHIHLWGFASPLILVYMSLLFGRGYPKWAILLWCFSTGLVVDIFSNTIGIGAASMTLVGALQPYWLGALETDGRSGSPLQGGGGGRETANHGGISVRDIGWVKYSVYASVLVLLFSLCYFTLETFSFFNWRLWLRSVLGSWALTLLLILTIESLRKR